MIRINFLPLKERKKKEEVQLWLILSGVIVLIEIVLLLIVNFSLQGKVRALERTKNEVKKKLDEANKKVAEVKDFENKKKEVEEKLKIVNVLDQDRDLIVHLLDELSKSVPYNPEARIKKRVQLTEFSKKGSQVGIKGIALDQESIAIFMRALENSPYYKSLKLGVVQAKSKGGYSYYEFSIDGAIETPEKEGG